MVLDVATKNILESENGFVIEQWKKLPDRYKPHKEKPPNENSNKPQGKDKQDGMPAKDPS